MAEIWFFTYYRVGWVGQSNLEWNSTLQCKQFQIIVFGKVRWAVGTGANEIFFRQRRLSPPRKIGPYAHVWNIHFMMAVTVCSLSQLISILRKYNKRSQTYGNNIQLLTHMICCPHIINQQQAVDKNGTHIYNILSHTSHMFLSHYCLLTLNAPESWPQCASVYQAV